MTNGEQEQEVHEAEVVEQEQPQPEVTPAPEPVSRRYFLRNLGIGAAGAAAGILGTLGLQQTACREKKPEEIAAFEIPFDNWLTVVGGSIDNEYMSRCGNFELGAAMLYLEDQEDVRHPRIDYKEMNKLVEREEKLGIHREKPQMTKSGRRGYNLRVVGIDGGKKSTEKYIERVLGRPVKVSREKSGRFAASPYVNVEDLGPGLYRDSIITANVDIIDVNLKRSEADQFE